MQSCACLAPQDCSVAWACIPGAVRGGWHPTYRWAGFPPCADEGRVQTSAAAFTKGLLDLEGAALTPILVRWDAAVPPPPPPAHALSCPARPCAGQQRVLLAWTTWLETPPTPHPATTRARSLVKKDAGMLDAFGKGASADIQLAKQELYAQVRRRRLPACRRPGMDGPVCLAWLPAAGGLPGRSPLLLAGCPQLASTTAPPPPPPHHHTRTHTKPSQMTWDPSTNTSMYAEPQLTTPMVSPPLSPKLDGGALPAGARALRSAGPSGTARCQLAACLAESTLHSPTPRPALHPPPPLLHCCAGRLQRTATARRCVSPGAWAPATASPRLRPRVYVPPGAAPWTCTAWTGVRMAAERRIGCLAAARELSVAGCPLGAVPA
jgi:hypothetical protein